MVEEFMLLANVTVAEKITQSFPTHALLRRHPPPSPHAFDALVDASKAVGVEIDVSTSKSLAESLEHAHAKDNPYFNRLLRILSTR